MSGAGKKRLFAALAPTTSEIRALARRETDPAECDRFTPICRGPVMAFLLLGVVGVAALVVVPLRLLAVPFRRHEAAAGAVEPPVGSADPTRPA